MKSKRSSAHARLFLGTLLVLTLLGLTSTSQAQIGSGQIVGVVQDPTGAVIPGARVVVRHVATGMERMLTTNEVGRYSALNLRPGEYEITVEASGFATIRRVGIMLTVGQTATVDFSLQVAAAAEVITVTEDAPITEPDRTEYTVLVSERAVENLPINGRRWDRFILLTPTVAPDGDFGLISVRGVSGLYNNNMVDGADDNQAFFSEARGRTRTSYTLSQAAIKEFQVGISNYTAEFGRAVGGTINAVTKSGGSDFHGEAFYFIRDDAFNARDALNKADGLEQLPERRQQLGFSMGGPVVQDKLFWFLNYDKQHRNFPGVAVNQGDDLTDPTETRCDIPSVPGRCDAARAELLSRLGPFNRKGLNDVALGKLDWQVNDKHTLSGQYSYHQWRSPNGIQTQKRTNDTPLANGFDGVRIDRVLFRLTSLTTGNTVNEFRFQYGNELNFQRNNSPGPMTDHGSELNIDDGMREFLPRPAYPDEDRYQWIDNFSWMRGRHLLKVGADINYVRELQINLRQGGGEYDYRTFEDWAMDVPLPGLPVPVDIQGGVDLTGRHYDDFEQAFDITTGGIGRVFFTTTDWNFYVQDTWKVHPHLTLNLGLRYEYTDVPQPEQSKFGCIDAGTCPNFAALPGNVQTLARRMNQDKNNFGPRLAFAWDIGGRQKLVLRTGYGLYYGRTSNSALSGGIFEKDAITRFSLEFDPDDAFAPAYPNTFCTPALGTPGQDSVCAPPPVAGEVELTVFSEDYARPLIHSMEFELEYALTPNTSVSASYLGTRGLRLPAFIDINLSPPTDTVTIVESGGANLATLPFFGFPRPFSGFGTIIMSESTVNSWFNALVLRGKRRFSEGLAFDAHYTWSKALDENQVSQTFFSSFGSRVDPRDRKAEYGPSRFDIRQKFVGNFYWDPPFERIENDGLRNALEGFILSGILTLRDGRAWPTDLNMNRLSFPFFIQWGGVSTFTANGSGGDDRAPWIGPNTATTSGFAVFDFRVRREFRFGETMKAVFIWEAFNLFNRVNSTFFRDDAFRGTASCTISGGGFFDPCDPGTRIVTVTPRSDILEPFNTSSTLHGPREMQFAFKFIW